MTATPQRSNSPIGTAMAILRCFTAQRPVLGVVEIADLVGLHKSSVSRMLVTLEAEDLVEQDPLSKKYRLSLGLLSVAGSLLGTLEIRRAAVPVLTALTAATSETSSLMLWDGGAAVSVEQVPSPLPIKHTADLGIRYPAPDSASTRVFLAALSPPERADILAAAGVTAQQYEELVVDDTDDVAVNVGQTRPDEVGIAAAVRDHRGQLVAAVLLSAPRYRVPVRSLAPLIGDVRSAAGQLTVALGGTAPVPDTLVGASG